MEINIKTKFNVGDRLLFYNTDTSKLEEFNVFFINVNAYAEKTDVFYFNELGTCKLETNLFASKDEFIAQL